MLTMSTSLSSRGLGAGSSSRRRAPGWDNAPPATTPHPTTDRHTHTNSQANQAARKHAALKPKSHRYLPRCAREVAPPVPQVFSHIYPILLLQLFISTVAQLSVYPSSGQTDTQILKKRLLSLNNYHCLGGGGTQKQELTLQAEYGCERSQARS